MAATYGWVGFETGIIMDCLDGSEYQALADTNKEYYKMVISAGIINFQSGSPMWNLIHAIFPDGTNTWNAILLATECGRPKA